MNFLVIEQDLRVSGTSQGVISRSFLGKLRTAYPEAIIDVLYLKRPQKSYTRDNQLELLPVNNIYEHVLNLNVSLFRRWCNKLYWRLFHVSLKENYIHSVYASYIAKIDYKKYDHIFIRSAGLAHETILACKDLPILKRAIVNFHDPYPLFWYPGSGMKLTNLELFRLKKMREVIGQAKTCMSSANLMSESLQYLYGSKKKFYTLPHQYDASLFDTSDTSQVIKKTKKVCISYQGALMFGRNAYNLLLAYQNLLEEDDRYKNLTEFVLRLKGDGVEKLKQHFGTIENIKIMNITNFSNSSHEQMYESDILIILENGPLCCNILVGKAPFVASLNKPVLCLSPEKSELKNIIVDERCIANMNDVKEIKEKLKGLIDNRLVSNEEFRPFANYFGDDNFGITLDYILNKS